MYVTTIFHYFFYLLTMFIVMEEPSKQIISVCKLIGQQT